ncbi:MAG: MFS transporter, partial [Methylobacteriaceae bacterium]|nr:MFS transporter [Methylobacteriaceae bacterium]
MSVAEEIVASDAAPAGNYARKALAASAVGYAMDGFDFLILGFMMSAIARDLGLGATAGASLATFTLIGAVIG